ncbi:lipase (class 2) [Nocardioides sp. J9]|uniref:esterase/lipase family protein n=1 Tax=Nocardioides sp. J9 TaxID=935844 RepID=UPI0011A462EE|nr:alpha/beta fold hydrolase [Nocardioides sp. J9]TWG97094.1 lipase (class 2) [Nocardioides sp. J9]
MPRTAPARLVLRTLALLLPLVLAAGVAAAPAQADPPPKPLPVTWNVSTVLQGGLSRALVPGWSPAGSNDPTCRLTPDRPRPVVLVNFTTGSGWEWGAGSPYLRNNGFCVFHFTYGNITPLPQFPVQAIGDIRKSAVELRDFVEEVRARTGVAKVDLVGWSQGGGMTPHYYINFLGGADKVDRFVAIAPGNHGTDGSGLLRPTTLAPLMYPILLALLPAFGQQVAGTELAEEVYADGDTRPGPHYTTIITKHDEIATPWTNQLLEDDGTGNVDNIVLQDSCAKDRSDHLSIGFSERTWRFVVNALAPRDATPVPCIPVLPYWGSGGGLG